MHNQQEHWLLILDSHNSCRHYSFECVYTKHLFFNRIMHMTEVVVNDRAPYVTVLTSKDGNWRYSLIELWRKTARIAILSNECRSNKCKKF